jgi:hypothetical protein
MIYWLLQRGADPSLAYYQGKPVKRTSTSTIETIFWYPDHPLQRDWQRRCQQWLLQRGYRRPPLPKYLREMRIDSKLPVEEKDVPLILPPTTKD